MYRVVAPDCAQVPEYLRKGPVSPVAPLTVATIAIAMAIYWPGVPSSPPVGVELAALKEAAGSKITLLLVSTVGTAVICAPCAPVEVVL